MCSVACVKRACQCVSLVDYIYSVARRFWTLLSIVELKLLFILKLPLFLGAGYLPVQVICICFICISAGNLHLFTVVSCVIAIVLSF